MKRFVLAVGVALVAVGLSVAVAMAGGLVSICKLIKERS